MGGCEVTHCFFCTYHKKKGIIKLNFQNNAYFCHTNGNAQQQKIISRR